MKNALTNNVEAILAIIIVSAVVVIAILNRPIPTELVNALVIVLTFFFGRISGAAYPPDGSK